MRRILEWFKTAYRTLWADNPWFMATGFVVTPILGFLFVMGQLPEDLRYAPSPQQIPVLALCIAVGYLLLTSALFANKVRYEREYRRKEGAFKYDKRGTLYNNSEPNMAFHVETFKKLLSGLAERLGDKQTETALTEVGYESCEDFSSRFPRIYDNDRVRGLHTRLWKTLSFKEKLSEWADYESASGWGIFSAEEVDTGIVVNLTHFRGLFDERGGLLFGYYLGGYCQRLLNMIVSTHAKGPRPGKYADLQEVQLKSVEGRNQDTIILKFVWR